MAGLNEMENAKIKVAIISLSINEDGYMCWIINTIFWKDNWINKHGIYSGYCRTKKEYEENYKRE